MQWEKKTHPINEPRSFNRIKVLSQMEMLLKESDNAETLDAEKAWYRLMPKELANLHPRIYGLDCPGKIVMEYLDCPTAHQLYMNGKLSAAEWLNIFIAIKAITDTFRSESYSIRIAEREAEELIDQMYVEKTERRLNELRQNELFEPMYRCDIKINGIRYIGLSKMIDVVKHHARNEIGRADRVSIIHGDLHLGNILVGSHGNTVKLIDPRGKFGRYVVHGDGRYDTAKLMHSMEGGYDLIVEDNFTVKYDPRARSIKYRFNRGARNRMAEWAFSQVYGAEIDKDRKALTIIEALLFLSMIPLHSDSPKRQLVMLARGYELIEKALGSAYSLL